MWSSLLALSSWGFVAVALPPSVEKILKPYGTQASFSAQDATGKELANYQGDVPFTPASVAKLVSSACSFSHLGPSFKFETRILTTGVLKDGVLSGNLIFKGAGDPSFVIENLKEILEQLYVVFGIREIRGELIFDLSYLGVEFLSLANGFEGDEGRSFAADLSALPFNFSSFSFWIWGGDGKIITSVLPKDSVSVRMQSQLTLAPSGSTQVSVNFNPKTQVAGLSGKVASGAEPRVIYRAVPNHFQYVATSVERVWKELGGRWPGFKWRTSTAAVAGDLRLIHRSQPVSKLLMDVNKLSTNYAAELILMAAAVQRFGVPGTQEKMKRLLSDCLQSSGFKPEQINLENASGLSRTSRISASALSEFLRRVSQSAFGPEYLSTLSILGVDGTTRARLPDLSGRARLKTGTLRGVRTISGYVYGKDRSAPKTFSLFFNCGNCSADQMQRSEDALIQWLASL